MEARLRPTMFLQIRETMTCKSYKTDMVLACTIFGEIIDICWTAAKFHVCSIQNGDKTVNKGRTCMVEWQLRWTSFDPIARAASYEDVLFLCVCANKVMD